VIKQQYFPKWYYRRPPANTRRVRHLVRYSGELQMVCNMTPAKMIRHELHNQILICGRNMCRGQIVGVKCSGSNFRGQIFGVKFSGSNFRGQIFGVKCSGSNFRGQIFGVNFRGLIFGVKFSKFREISRNCVIQTSKNILLNNVLLLNMQENRVKQF